LGKQRVVGTGKKGIYGFVDKSVPGDYKGEVKRKKLAI
jgi:hypothetical protein